MVSSCSFVSSNKLDGSLMSSQAVICGGCWEKIEYIEHGVVLASYSVDSLVSEFSGESVVSVG